MSIEVLELAKNSELFELSIDMQEGVGGGEYGDIYQAGQFCGNLYRRLFFDGAPTLTSQDLIIVPTVPL